MTYRYDGPVATLHEGKDKDGKAKTRVLITGKTYEALPGGNPQVKRLKAMGVLVDVSGKGHGEQTLPAKPEESTVSEPQPPETKPARGRKSASDGAPAPSAN